VQIREIYFLFPYFIPGSAHNLAHNPLEPQPRYNAKTANQK